LETREDTEIVSNPEVREEYSVKAILARKTTGDSNNQIIKWCVQWSGKI